MKSGILASILALTVAAASFAGDAGQKVDMKAKMEMMKADMMKCAICKHMAAHLDELAPVMTMEVVEMNNGMALVHTVTDPAKVDLYHSVGNEMMKAGQSCATMTEEQAKTQLCAFCQEIHGVMQSGAAMSMGQTKSGDIMVLTTSDPKLMGRLGDLRNKCAMMAASM